MRLICFINIDASNSTQLLWEQELKDIHLLPYPSRQLHFACMSVHTHTHTHTQTHTHKQKKAKKTNTLISQILHKSRNYNAHHSVSVFLPVNHMNYNCFMNILRGNGAHSNLRWSLHRFQGQLTRTTPPFPPASPASCSLTSHLWFELRVEICLTKRAINSIAVNSTY